MPAPRTVISAVLDSVIRRATIAIVQSATRAQVDLDAYVASQSVSLSPESVRALVFGGSTVTSAFSESFKNRMVAIMTGALNQSWQGGMDERHKEKFDGGKRFVWTINSTASGTHCPDCTARSGRVETMEQWELLGKPQSGFSICGSRCKCTLEPTK